jgi:DNA-binding transcriptional MerR regulator
MSEFLDTIGELASAAEVTPQTVHNYAKAGLLEFIIAPNGHRFFKSGQVQRVKEIYAANIKRRGNRRETGSVEISA